MSRRAASKASLRCGALAATTTATSPTASNPVRCTTATAHTGTSATTWSHTRRSAASASRMRDVLECRHRLAAVGVSDDAGEGDGAARVRVSDRGQRLFSGEGDGSDLYQAQGAHASPYSS